MRKILLFIILNILIFDINCFSQVDTLKKIKVYIFSINQEINSTSLRITQRAFKEINLVKPELIILHLNTYGGLVDVADSIRTKILNSKIPIYAFIDNNAASAGALISVACDKIYMRDGASIGAATVVNENGEAMPDKYQSYMRSIMRSTAEAHGKDTIILNADTSYVWHRNPNIAEAMVDQSIYLKGISDSGKVVTFTPEEAIKYGFCEGKAENIKEILDAEGIKNYEIIKQDSSAIDYIMGFLLNPFFHSILIMIIIGGIYFELQTPGIGFPIAASVIAAILYFSPLYFEGIAENWEILVFVIGVILVVLEIFVIPGFGIAGISGIILVVTGLTLSMVDNIVFTVGSADEITYTLLKAFTIVILSFLISLLLSFYFSKKLFTSKRFGYLALNKNQEISEGYISVDALLKNKVGSKAVALTVLRPGGKIEIENEAFDAVSLSGFIERGENLIVKKFEQGQLYVDKIK